MRDYNNGKRIYVTLLGSALALTILVSLAVVYVQLNGTVVVTPTKSEKRSTFSQPAYLPFIANHVQDTDAWYLLVDDTYVSMREVARTYYPFKKYAHNPVLRADTAWEGRIVQIYGSVFPGFEMWYSSYNPKLNIPQVLYAQSQDGIQWKKPNLDGSGKNALFGGMEASTVSVLSTPLDPDQPIKFMLYHKKAFYGYWSQDSTHPQPYAQTPLFSNNHDVAQFAWDKTTNTYIGSVKDIIPIRNVDRRVVGFIKSKDFITWEPQAQTLAPDVIDDQMVPGLTPHFYGLSIYPEGKQYLGFLWVQNAPDNSGSNGKVNVQLVSSPDGINWIREEGNRPPILGLGAAGAWDSSQIYTASQPVQVGDEFWMYYTGCNKQHGSDLSEVTCSIGLATAPYNRLAALNGSGTVETRSFTLAGTALRLNYDGSQGSIQVELFRNGKVIPGYEANNCDPLTQNSQDQAVTWKGKHTLPSGSFQIRFRLNNSALFAFI